jgi:hypothetical protein
MWEYNHNNVFSVYRIYYRGIAVDPNIFPPVAPREVEVPTKKTDPAPAPAPAAVAVAVAGAGVSAPSLPPAGLAVKSDKVKSVELTNEERRALLKEVKDHTELLREFVGVVPDDELAERKRALYAALPPLPPPDGKKQKKAKTTSAAVAKTSSMDAEDLDEIPV